MVPLLKIYHRIIDNKNRFLLFDYESDLSYVYTTDRLYPVRLYMEPECYNDITEGTISTYARKNKYDECAILYIDSDTNNKVVESSQICNNMHSEISNMINGLELFSNRYMDTLSVYKKLSDIIKLTS